MGIGLSACILNHALANVYAHQRHRWIGLGSFHDPATSATSHIQHTMEDSRVGLLWQDTTHRICHHTILDCQTGEFFLILSILNKIRTGIFIVAWAKGSRHNGALLLLVVCL